MRQPMIPALENLASRGREDIARLLGEAYGLGRADMRRELMKLLSPPGTMEAAPTVTSASITEKLPPGTVKPAIRALIEASNGGLTTEDIIDKTGFKENSVRGTLSALSKEGRVMRNGRYWRLASQQRNEAPAEESEGAS